MTISIVIESTLGLTANLGKIKSLSTSLHLRANDYFRFHCFVLTCDSIVCCLPPKYFAIIVRSYDQWRINYTDLYLEILKRFTFKRFGHSNANSRSEINNTMWLHSVRSKSCVLTNRWMASRLKPSSSIIWISALWKCDD